MNHRIWTKEEAWADPPGIPLKNIDIDRSGHEFQFTRRWFKLRNQTTFSTFLPPKFDGTKPVKLIQIGVFEGMDLVWQMQNTLRHPESYAFAIDPWMATTKLDAEHMEATYQRARHNLRPYRAKVQIFRGYSQRVFAAAVQHGQLSGIPVGEWDIVIIDGDHRKDAVIQDATYALQLVKPGGWLLFDDVRCQTPKKDEVEAGLRAFLDQHGDSVELAWSHRFCDCYEVKIEDYESSESDSWSFPCFGDWGWSRHGIDIEEERRIARRAYRHYRSHLRKES